MGKLKRPEDLLVEQIMNRLDNWERKGVVVDYENLSNAGRKFINGYWIMNTQKGRRDVVAYIIHNKIAWVYLIEAKTTTGVQSFEQMEYADKFRNCENVVYEVVRDSVQVDRTIDRITGWTAKSMEGWQVG